MTLTITANAVGPQAKTQTFTQLLPEGASVKVAGTNDLQVYFASHQMNVFDKKNTIPVNGRVVDLSGGLITDPATPMEVIMGQPYGSGCLRQVTVPVLSTGFFETTINQMSDKRNFKTKVKLNSGPEYLKIEQHLD
mmetsp:Transcript_34461/g.45334  ORF Transcript_34461/g.45334 Transcript_34461/m.45334 type:complete len:136 (-) Transcript_34461:1011-1418(-)